MAPLTIRHVWVCKGRYFGHPGRLKHSYSVADSDDRDDEIGEMLSAGVDVVGENYELRLWEDGIARTNNGDLWADDLPDLLSELKRLMMIAKLTNSVDHDWDALMLPVKEVEHATDPER